MRDVITCKPTYMLMGMSAETFWGGVAGNAAFEQRIADQTGGLRVSTGAASCRAALEKFGARRIAVFSPYQPIADQQVGEFFREFARANPQARLDTEGRALWIGHLDGGQQLVDSGFVAGLGEEIGDGLGHRLHPVARPQLAHDLAQVVLHRQRTDAQLLADLRVAAGHPHRAQHSPRGGSQCR